MIILKRKLKKKLNEIRKERNENLNRWNPKMPRSKKIAWAKKQESLNAKHDLLKELLNKK